MRKNSFIQGALILTVAGIIVKFIGAFSRIYLSRLLGGEGIGLYQMAYPIYLLCLSLSSAGLPVAISIMVAERNALNDYHGGQKVFRISMAALVLTGLFFSVLLFFGAQWLVDTGIGCFLRHPSGNAARLFPGSPAYDAYGSIPDSGAGGAGGDHDCLCCHPSALRP